MNHSSLCVREKMQGGEDCLHPHLQQEEERKEREIQLDTRVTSLAE